MPTEEHNQDELLAGVYQGDIKPQVVKIARTDFKAWHKPRKHFLRIHQWCHEIQKLIRNLHVESGVFRYLGLPGEDLLDLHVIKGACPPGVQLRYLGFDSSRSPELNLAQNEINSDKSIDPTSRVINDRIESITNTDSMAYQYVSNDGPFDVINLDFCESVTHAEDGGVPQLEAIGALCELQAKKRGQPWILLLTTRAIRTDLADEVKRSLFGTVITNINDHANFSSELGKKLGLDLDKIEKELKSSPPLSDSDWLNVYMLSLCKWLLHFMMRDSYSVSVTLLPSYIYGVHGKTPDMVSFAFRFESAVSPRKDPSGLIKTREEEVAVPTEAELAINIVEGISKVNNVDEILRTDNEKRKKITAKSAKLLEGLRYDMDAYNKFIAS